MPFLQMEAVFRSLQRELAARPAYHRLDPQPDARILVAFLAYRPLVTLKNPSALTED